MFPRSKEVNAVGLDPIIRPFDSDRGNQRGVFLKTLSSEIYPTLESVSFNGLGTGLTIPSHSIVFHDCLLNLYGWVFSIPASNQPPFHFHLCLPGFIPG